MKQIGVSLLNRSLLHDRLHAFHSAHDPRNHIAKPLPVVSQDTAPVCLGTARVPVPH